MGQLLPFRARLGFHLAVVAVVATSAVAGGRFISNPTTVASEVTAATATASALVVAQAPRSEARNQAPAAVALTVFPASASKAEAAPAPAVASQPQAIAFRAEEVSKQIKAAPPLAIDTQPGLLAQADGVVMARALSSSRGGLRAPTPVASPTPAPTASPAASPTSSAPAKKEPLKVGSYKVQSGDTLLGIAEKFGITPETILWANDLGNGEMLSIDHELVILPVSGVLHTVRKGQTFKEIAEAYVADAKTLIEANGIDNADMLSEGQVLIVPGGMMRTTEIAALPSAPSAQELAKAVTYVVKPGDTLLSIADGFGVRASVIQVANDLMDPDALAIGQKLKIPGGTAPAPAAAPAPKPQPAAPAPAPKPAAPAPTPKPAAPAPKPAPEPEPAAAGDEGDAIAAFAQKFVGYRYVWGGTSPAGFDCSGFVWYVYKQNGISIPRSPLEGQVASGPRISRDKLLPGDLVFFENTYKPGLSHVGIYLGGGRFINAETEASGVQIRSLSDPYWAARYVGASRPW